MKYKINFLNCRHSTTYKETEGDFSAMSSYFGPKRYWTQGRHSTEKRLNFIFFTLYKVHHIYLLVCSTTERNSMVRNVSSNEKWLVKNCQQKFFHLQNFPITISLSNFWFTTISSIIGPKQYWTQSRHSTKHLSQL